MAFGTFSGPAHTHVLPSYPRLCRCHQDPVAALYVHQRRGRGSRLGGCGSATCTLVLPVHVQLCTGRSVPSSNFQGLLLSWAPPGGPHRSLIATEIS